jgi:hypothetical protein
MLISRFLYCDDVQQLDSDGNSAIFMPQDSDSVCDLTLPANTPQSKVGYDVLQVSIPLC